MPRLKKKEDDSSPPDATQTLTAGRSRRTIKPNRKYLNDSVVLATASKGSSRSSSADSDVSEDDYRQEEDDDEEVIPKSAAGRKSAPSATAAAKKGVSTPAPRGRGRPPKLAKSVAKTEPIKNLRKEVLKKMDLSMLNLGKARVVLTPINKRDIKRKLDLDESLEKIAAKTSIKPKEPEKSKEKEPEKRKEKEPEKRKEKELEKRKEKELEKRKEKEPEKSKEKEPERPKLRVPAKAKEPEKSEKPEKDKSPPVKAKDEKEKPKPVIRVFRRKQPEQSKPKEDSNELKKVINPVAVKRQLVEKSILDKRAKKQDEFPEEDDDDDDDDDDGDDDDDVQIVGVTREAMPNVRKFARKSPLVTKQISPLARKIVRPITGKAVAPMQTAGVKRKPTDSMAEEEKSAKIAKKSSFTKAPRLSISFDSEDSEDSEDEPVRRTTRGSLTSDKSSAASTPQTYGSAAAKAKGSPASTGAKPIRISEVMKSNLTKSVSLPALDKAKANVRTFGSKPVQTPVAKALGLPKPMAQSTPKTSLTSLVDKKSKSELNLVDPIHSPDKKKDSDKIKSKQATIRIVDIGDIIKKKSASTPDVRKAGLSRTSSFDEDSFEESDDSDSDYSPDHSESRHKTSSAEKPKTNNQLVASILERKRPINLDHLRANRVVKRSRPVAAKPPLVEKPIPKTVRQSVINLTEEDEIDFEDMLQTNIVTANKVQKVIKPNLMRDRRRDSEHTSSDENTAKPSSNSGQRTGPLNRSMGASSSVKTLASSNNNNVYKTNSNGRFGSSGSINRSGSVSPQKNPPRILNSTMKLGDSRPFAKLVANSGNKHYSIDLTDPDNNVKLIASPDSPPHSPIKRSPIKGVPRPIVASSGLRNASNALNKPIGGAVQRSISSLTSSSGSSPKMKKITCYETWYVINIPNNENKPERPSFAMSMIGLGNEAAKIQLPSQEWSHKIILTKRKVPPNEGDEFFTGEVEDRAISEDEKRNYEPCNIMFRRRTATPGKFNLQYDRAVIFKNDTFFINVDGKNCQLVGAPSKLYGIEDIETLLAVVDFVNLKNACVELSTA